MQQQVVKERIRYIYISLRTHTWWFSSSGDDCRHLYLPNNPESTSGLLLVLIPPEITVTDNAAIKQFVKTALLLYT